MKREKKRLLKINTVESSQLCFVLLHFCLAMEEIESHFTRQKNNTLIRLIFQKGFQCLVQFAKKIMWIESKKSGFWF